MSNVDIYLEGLFTEAEGWKGTPKGWKRSSIKRFAKSLTGKEGVKIGFFDRCVKKMKGKVKSPEGFCAGIKDELHKSTYWRGKGKTPQQVGKAVKKHRNVKLEQLIKYIYEFEKIEKGHTLKCNICKREVLVQIAGQGPLMCCIKPMEVKNLLEEI